MVTRKYKTPPIEEALVEFHFASDRDWDLTIPGRLMLHEAMIDTYTGGSKTKSLVEATVNTEEGKPPTLAVREGLSRVQLLNDDGTRLVSVGKDVVSVNTLRPYDNWEDFLPRISAAIQAYKDVASPNGVTRIGVRYINKIVIPQSAVNPADYVRFSLPSSDGIPSATSGFICRSEYIYDDGARLILTVASVESPEDQCAFIVDVDVVKTFDTPLGIEEAMPTVEDLHGREGQAFEGLITSESRELFDAGR